MSGAAVAVVTGATGPIGAAIAIRLARTHGHVVGLHLANTVAASALDTEIAAIGGRITFLRADFAKPGAGLELAAEVGRVAGAPQTVVLAAAEGRRSLALATSDEAAARLFAVNVTGQIAFLRALLRPMIAARHGRIVVIGSRAVSSGMAGQAVYAATKAALSVYALSLASEVGRYGITVNVVAPGAMETSAAGYGDEEQRAITRRIAAGRLGRPEDVSGAVAYLCSDEAGYVTGTTLAVDGGARF